MELLVICLVIVCVVQAHNPYSKDQLRMHGRACGNHSKQIFRASCESCLCVNGRWACRYLRCISKPENLIEMKKLDGYLALDSVGCNTCDERNGEWFCTIKACLNSVCPCPQPKNLC